MYGTTIFGGTIGQIGGGTAFKIDPATTVLKIIYRFPDTVVPSACPATPLLQATDGNFYGGTQDLSLAEGEIFKMTPAGKVTPFYTFPQGEFLVGPLVQGVDGNFYGATFGTVFQLTPAATLTVLHTFGQGSHTVAVNGVIFGPNGNLYGTTFVGGTANRGTVFELSTDGSTYAVLHNFGDGTVPNDGWDPGCNLVLAADNNLYGTTAFGGSAYLGTVFKISP